MLLCRGIVPVTCDELFKAINENTDKNKASHVINLRNTLDGL